MASKQTLQEKIKAKSDRELQEDIAYFTNEGEKHLRNINNTLNWFFWIFIISIAIWIISAIMSSNLHNG